jgi:hypothetical protein
MSATALPVTTSPVTGLPPAAASVPEQSGPRTLPATVERPASSCAVIPMGLADAPHAPSPLPGLPVRKLPRRG